MNDVQDIDYLMNEFEQDKDNIVYLAKKNPKELVSSIWNELLAYDNNCHVMMKNIEEDIACTHCQHMMQMTDMNQYNVGELFKVTYGKRKGDSMIIVENEIKHVYLKWVSNNKIKGDNFTIKILVTWLVEDLFTSAGLPHALQMVTSFICNHVGYSLYKMPNVKGELCTFGMVLEQKKKDAVVYGILLQLVVIMNELEKVSFSFGNPSINAFLFDGKVCDYDYQKKEIKCPFTMVLSDMSKSSLKINNVLLFPNNSINSVMNNNFMDSGYKSVANDKYIIKDYLFDIVFDKVKYQLPSIDFYLILLSMTEEPIFMEVVTKNEQCKNLWQLIWGEKVVNEYDFTILKDVELYKNPMQHILNNL